MVVGVILTHPDAREILVGEGATIDGECLRLPPDLVESALEACPSMVASRGRDGKTATLGDGSLHWHNLGGARDVYDPVTGQCRAAIVQDVADAARLLDALPNCTAITPFFTPQDVPGKLMVLAMYRHTLPHTVKAVHDPGVHTAAEVDHLARMAEVIGPPAEMLSLGISPISPLTFPDVSLLPWMVVATASVRCTPSNIFEPERYLSPNLPSAAVGMNGKNRGGKACSNGHRQKLQTFRRNIM